MFIILFGYPLLKLLLFTLWGLIKYLMPYPNLKKRYCSAEKESWAVVTGATDGIGLGFCTVLASQGINIILISRDQAKLNNTVEYLKSIQQKLSVASQFKTIAFDFQDSHD
jgi:D-arabinose 1-dehydrogenase-like Zn-dependent alcohol dehydrogenase